MRIVLLGPPGAGKGTQGKLLAKELHLPRLSVGALVRRHATEKTPEGTEAEQFMRKGLAIPAELYIRIVSPWLLAHHQGFIVDNLVRTKDQLEEFRKFQEKHQFTLDRVLYLSLSENEARRRLMIRKRVKKRIDETPEALHIRFATFFTDMDTIFNYFKRQGIFEEVNAQPPAMEVHKDIMRRLQQES